MPFNYDKLKEKWHNEHIQRKKRSELMKFALITKGTPIFKKFGIQKVYVFGSVISQQAQETSDIDLLATPLSANQFWQFRHELEDAVNYPVDIYTQDDDPVFTDKIVKRGEIIYGI